MKSQVLLGDLIAVACLMWFLGSPFKKFGAWVSNICSYSKMFYQISDSRSPGIFHPGITHLVGGFNQPL